MKKTIRLLTIMLLATLFSCSQKQSGRLAEFPLLEESADAGNADISEESIIIEKRKMIKEGEIKFETANSHDTRMLIAKTVADTKGYISEDNGFTYDERIEHRITIRVPADKFESLLGNITQKVRKFDSKNINTLDVTEQFIDIEARIKTKKEVESRYKELLKQANKVDEILAIEKEIGNLRTEIESMEGKLNYLKDKISYSTLKVVFYEKTNSAFGFNSKMGQAMQNGWTNFLQFFVFLTNLWAFIATGLIIIFAYRLYRSKKRNAA